MKRQSFLILSFLVLFGISLTACTPSSELTSEELTAQASLVTESPVAVVQPLPNSEANNCLYSTRTIFYLLPTRVALHHNRKRHY